jgi:hypothetical protein
MDLCPINCIPTSPWSWLVQLQPHLVSDLLLIELWIETYNQGYFLHHFGDCFHPITVLNTITCNKNYLYFTFKTKKKSETFQRAIQTKGGRPWFFAIRFFKVLI